MLSVRGSGTVAKSPDQAGYNLGDPVTISASAARYFVFLRWSDGITNNPRAIVVGTNSAYTAIFTNTVPLESVGVYPLWDRSFGGNSNDVLRCVRQTPDGGFILGGTSQSGTTGNKTSPNLGGADFWVVRVDADGNKLWDRSFGGSGDDELNSLAQTADGGFILAGVSSSNADGNKASSNFGGDDYWVVRLGAEGNKLWDKSFGGDGQDWLNSVQSTADGGFLLGGWSGSGTNGNKTSINFRGGQSYWVVRVDANGNKLWDKSYGGGGSDYLNSVHLTTDGGFILGGQSDSGSAGDKSSASFGDFDFWMIRLNGDGNKLWDKSFGGTGHDSLDFVQEVSDGGFFLGGNSGSPANGNKASVNFGDFDYWVIRTDSTGAKLWEKSFGGTGTEYLYNNGVQQCSDGGFILGGQSNSNPSGNKTSPHIGGDDFWLVRLDVNGNKLWDRSFGGSEDDELFCLQQAADGGFILGGPSSSSADGNKTSPNFGGSDFWIVKVAEIELPVGTPRVLANGQYPVNPGQFIGASAAITMESSFQNGSIFYTLDGSAPGFTSPRYVGEFTITKTTSIRAIAYSADFSQSAEADAVTIAITPVYPLTTSSPGGGSIVVNSAIGPYPSNSVATATATPAAGWTFMNWTGDVAGTNPVVNVTMNQPKSIQAVFGTTLSTTIAGHGTLAFRPVHDDEVTLAPKLCDMPGAGPLLLQSKSIIGSTRVMVLPVWSI